MKMTAREVLVNIKNFDMWEYASYKLSQDEAAVVIEALEEKAGKENEYTGKRKKEKVRYTAKFSKNDNCLCNGCHSSGLVTKITYPETLYLNSRELTTKYHEWWLCADCMEKLLYAIRRKDGRRMTNRKWMIKQLQKAETEILSMLMCPYFSGQGLCDNQETADYNKHCQPCLQSWLESEHEEDEADE